MTALIQPSASQKMTSTDSPKRSVSNLIVRFMTGIVLLPIIVIAILWGGLPFAMPILFLAVLGAIEFYFMERHRGLYNYAFIGVIAAVTIVFAFHWRSAWWWQFAVVMSCFFAFALEFLRTWRLRVSLQRMLLMLGGLVYVAFPLSFFIALRQVEPFGIHWAFALIFCTWGNDTFAYFTGRFFGKTPLAPTLSPKKTREGALGGYIMGIVLPTLVLMRVDAVTWHVILMFAVASFACILGDLFESGMKRFFGIKDSHVPGLNILPGHGGILDRIDGMIWVLVVFYVYLLLIGEITLLF